jgi:hypothetical protein
MRQLAIVWNIIHHITSNKQVLSNNLKISEPICLYEMNLPFQKYMQSAKYICEDLLAEEQIY